MTKNNETDQISKCLKTVYPVNKDETVEIIDNFKNKFRSEAEALRDALASNSKTRGYYKITGMEEAIQEIIAVLTDTLIKPYSSELLLNRTLSSTNDKINNVNNGENENEGTNSTEPRKSD